MDITTYSANSFALAFVISGAAMRTIGKTMIGLLSAYAKSRAYTIDEETQGVGEA